MTTQYFEVETGSGSPTSNSYIDTNFIDQYFTDYGNTDWDITLPTADKQTALINATKALDLLYGQEWVSIPKSSFPVQALLWPRFVVIVNRIQLIQPGQIPVQVKQAVAEIALMYSNGQNIFPQSNPATQIRSQTNKIGNLEESITYLTALRAERYPGFNKVDLFMRPFLSETYTNLHMTGVARISL